MVGVPGRSKACLVCKKRRIQCDLQQPCSQCTRSSRDCEYATKSVHIFVHHEGKHKTVYRKSDRKSKDNEPSTPAATPQIDGYRKPLSHRVPPAPDNVAIPRPIGTLTALNQQLLASACENDLLQSVDRTVSRPWTYTLSSFAGSIHALNSAPLSCYTAWMGRRNKDPYLVEASRCLYIQGLKEVQEAVNDPATALRDETLGACLGLIVYEALECPDRSRTGYAAHVAGCARIVKMRGASMHQEGVAHELFRAFRYIALLHDLEKHEPSFLSTHAWTTLPWQRRPKSMYDRLLDLLSLAPEVLQKSDRLSTIGHHDFLPAIVDVAQKVLMTDSKLQTFYAELIDSCPGPLYWEEPSRMVALNDEPGTGALQSTPQETVIQFRDYETSQILTLYWAMLALSWSGLSDLCTEFGKLLANPELVCLKFLPVVQRLPLKPKDWMDPCRKVCQSVQYCSSEGQGEIGPLRISVPLDMVTEVMRGRPECAKEYGNAVKVGKDISLSWLRILQFRA